ncbi:hypothetical protein HGA13_05265 [Nocardia speluncae]|uniref:DUF8020 domain-containing protein n=1 Tax=Nocardia speluncae TaxID=419477 RepID=A0A846XCT2_9NOCA|nr:hypothetical protein [Nocardia speluncae]NKY32486.1 hypothetical protein [Nocardia speluncae]
MKYRRFAATAIMAAAATGIGAGTGYAAPAPAAPAVEQSANAVPEVTGHDRGGLDYTLALAEAGKSLVTTVSGGAFSLDAANNAVVLTSAAGECRTSIPLNQQTGGEVVAVAATIDEDSRRLTLTPQATPVAGAPGAIIGAGIGLAVAGGPPLLDSAMAYFSGQP